MYIELDVCKRPFLHIQLQNEQLFFSTSVCTMHAMHHGFPFAIFCVPVLYTDSKVSVFNMASPWLC